MSFYIRKSVKFGPIRLNFSKSGVGLSTGVKGARISTGPRGTHIHMGRNGVYYRQRLDRSTSGTSPSSQTDADGDSETFVNDVPTDNGNELLESSNEELLTQINSNIDRPTHGFIIGAASTVIAGVLASLAYVVQLNSATISARAFPILFALPLVIAAVIWITGLSVAWVTNQQEKLERSTTLQYELDDATKVRFAAVQGALADLANSAGLWHVVSQTQNWDWKRNAGASSIMTRKRITVGQTDPPFIQTKIAVFGILLNSMHLYFLPDQILIFRGGHYASVSYSALRVHSSLTRFIEDEGVPSDSVVVDYTWQYVRKDGGPDLRFRNNRQIPIAQYAHVQLSSHSGMDLNLLLSSPSRAQQFGQALLKYIENCQGPSSNSSSRKTSGYEQSSGYQEKEQPKTRDPKEPRDESPFSVLRVSPSASREEITSAYRKLAQMYHPDKVAGLGPEFRELAESRMKEINAAYEQLKRNFRE